MEFINANDLPAAGAMSEDNCVLVQQGGKFMLMTLAELLNYMASASVETDATLTQGGVAADSKTTGEAFKAARAANLLDNSDFRNPVNQRGKASYTSGGYTIDRWRTMGGYHTITVQDGYLDISYSSAGQQPSGYLYQKIEPGKITAGKKYTAAICMADGAVHILVAEAPAELSTSLKQSIGENGYLEFCTDAVGYRVSIGVYPDKTLSVAWVALYEGEYTVTTLPKYQTKGYAAELTECRRYYRQSWSGALADMSVSGSVPFIRSTGGANTQMAVNWHGPMRITPTIKIYSPATKAENYIRDWIGSADKPVGGAGYASPYGFCLVLNNSGTTAGVDYVFHYTASADL